MNRFNLKNEIVDESSVIRSLMECGITPYMHGLSGDGKSARIKELDPTLEVIRVANATPERICGKSVYHPARFKVIETIDSNNIERKIEEIEPGHMEDIKPAWLVRLEKKCQKEPDRLHIVFFDELSNALPTISNFIYNIILNGEVNGKWELPENARVVAAGNEMKDSLAANELPRPLFSRMAHMYVNTNIDNWTLWACRNNIHPAVIAFNNLNNGKYLRTPYTGLRPNADPRKWEMVSKVITIGQTIDPLYTLIDNNIVAEFTKFLYQCNVSLNDLIENNLFDDAKEQVSKMNLDTQYLFMANLSLCNEDDLPNIYSIIQKMDEKCIKLFNLIWTKNDKERIERLKEVKEKTKQKIYKR